MFAHLPWCYGLAAWDGTNWTSLGRGIQDLQDTPDAPSGYPKAYVNSIAVATNGHVFAAGSFVMPTPHGFATNVAEWNGHDWQPLGAGLSGSVSGSFPVMSIALSDTGDLYAGGSFINAGGVPARHLARWDGTRWWSVGTDLANGVNGTVEAVAVHGRDVYVGGSFSEAGGLSAARIARWNGQFWSPLGSGVSNGIQGEVFALACDDTGVYVGGRFGQAGGWPANNLAKWEFAPPPVRAVELHGLVSDDGLPTGGTLNSKWVQVSGPGIAQSGYALDSPSPNR
jgi:hypothetical protein